MNKNRDMALFLVFCQVILWKFIRRRDQQFLKVGGSNFPPVLDVGERCLSLTQ